MTCKACQSHKTPFDYALRGTGLRGLGQTDLLDTTLAATYDTVRIETQVVPAFDVPLRGPSTFGATADYMGRFVKPKITLIGKAGSVVIAPYGEPNQKLAPFAAFGAIPALVGIGIVIGRATKK
jgi:hypothetical protein